MKKLTALTLLPVIGALALWASSYCCSTMLSFGLPPYDYNFRTYQGVVWAERVYACLHPARPRWEFAEASEFLRRDYLNWDRAHGVEERFGVITWDVSYVISPEATALEPNLAVTPAEDIVVPLWMVLGLSSLPWAAKAGIGACVSRRKKKANLSPAPIPSVTAAPTKPRAVPAVGAAHP